ncbi:alpha/beta fold hydrolase BchO [Rubritepida flocculans]|uniref:alpha/beta fold hydrolase BchO n=1 Tax=Rubritepida flocculans TaxID=182403 RepID=UPI00040FC37F|nr:alpha/beta fold hydrolase BchO [Rubritepida flocculans]
MSMALVMAQGAIAPPPPGFAAAAPPLAEASRFVLAAGLRWHVQMLGAGPAVLLLHGTGASSHSWRDVAPLLAGRFSVIIPDLPGMGFSARPPPGLLTLEGMARGLAALLAALGVSPVLAAGHSAGAAVAIRLALDGAIAPRAILSFNGALLPLGGWAGMVFGPLGRVMVGLPGLPRLFAWQARDRATVERLLRDTGSTLTPEGVEHYARLFRNPEHVAATLGMMAAWDLPRFARDLPRLAAPLHLVVGQQDRTIRPSEALRLRRILPAARIHALPGLGHLAHEEAPERAARIILEAADG